MANPTSILDLLILHEREIRGFLVHRLRCPQQAADIFQDIAERVLRRPTQPYGNPRAYLFQAASHAIIDLRRSENCRHRHVEETLLRDDLEENPISPEREVQAQETMVLIEKALAELPPLNREIFYLYRIECMSHAAIASQLGISRSTVERRLEKTIRHWQRRLQEAGAI